MGIDIHALNFLRYCAKRQKLGRTVTLGRQRLHLSERNLAAIVPRGRSDRYGPYCEALLLDYFGALTVDSIDNSGYEGATIIADLNQPIPALGTFDTIIDGGSTEHIFDIAQAYRNIGKLAEVGAQVVHVVPANQFCGHGFWQMSPEVFFSLYSVENGFSDTNVFVADLDDESNWYEVGRPEAGKRIEIASRSPLYLLVRTIKSREATKQIVQQSDYAFAWQLGTKSAERATKLKDLGRRIARRYELRNNRIEKNKNLRRLSVRSLVA